MADELERPDVVARRNDSGVRSTVVLGRESNKKII
jgi:hypothetical protein